MSTERKFQLGQLVQVIKTKEHGTVVRYDKEYKNLCVVLFNRLNEGAVELLYAENALQVVNLPEQCPFHPGDRVEIIERCVQGTIHSIESGLGILVRQDDTGMRSGPWAPSELRKVESTIETPVPLPPTQQQIDGNHYRKLSIDPVEYSLANDLNCLQFSIVKHATRYPDKDEAVLDLQKVIHYAQIALERQYNVLSQVSYQEPT